MATLPKKEKKKESLFNKLTRRRFDIIYSITVNTEPSPPTETFEPPEPNPDS